VADVPVAALKASPAASALRTPSAGSPSSSAAAHREALVRFDCSFGAPLLAKPEQVAISLAGDVLVADSRNHCVRVFSGTHLKASLGTEGAGLGQLKYPMGVAQSAAGDVYVAELGNRRIHVFCANGGVFVFSAAGGDAQLVSPRGVAVAHGEVFVADFALNRVIVFRLDGSFVRTIGTAGTGTGQLRKPYGVAVGPGGEVFVADSDNNRVQVFRAADGAFLREFGARGAIDGMFKNPTGVAVAPDGAVYVCDSDNHRVQVFQRDGVFVRKFGEEGSGDGQLQAPVGIAVGPQGIFVADTGNNRVQRFV
jgi:tripartite motif-containing protein 71